MGHRLLNYRSSQTSTFHRPPPTSTVGTSAANDGLLLLAFIIMIYRALVLALSVDSVYSQVTATCQDVKDLYHAHSCCGASSANATNHQQGPTRSIHPFVEAHIHQ